MLANTEEFMRAIDDGDLEVPDLMPWTKWMAYRAVEGRRPANRRGDSTTTTLKYEGVMWREVMSAVYGLEWQVELRTQNKDAAQAGGSDGASQQENSQVNAGADEAPAAEIAQERQSAAGTNRSFGAETVSDGGPSAPGLRQRLMVGIDPSKETVADFIDKTISTARALDAVGDPVAEEDLAEILVEESMWQGLGSWHLMPKSHA